LCLAAWQKFDITHRVAGNSSSPGGMFSAAAKIINSATLRTLPRGPLKKTGPRRHRTQQPQRRRSGDHPMSRKTRYATAGSLESIATSYRDLAEAAEMDISDVVDLALADRLSVAARKAEQRKARSQTIKRIMITRAKQHPPVV